MLWPTLVVALGLAAEPTLRPVRVPPEIAAVTCAPELSGLVWSAPLDRFLAVSDDTGLAERGQRHAPMVLGLDVGGKLDEEPIPIVGIDSLNDSEAICAGPGGTFFLATSHSPDSKGRTRRSRRQLLQLEPRGRSLTVIGRVDLTAIEGGRSLLEIAHLAPEGRLDIEAIAYHDGALLVGLKSPLTAEGKAVILRLANPAEAAREGRIAAGALALWVELPLCVPARGERACQGVSDMLFLDDGSLLLSANSPKGQRSDGGGAIWRLQPPFGEKLPRLLHRFAGLKPEGIAFSPRRRALLVVFDRGQEAPLWTEIPVPADSAKGAKGSSAAPR